ncbi:MAG: chorismate synthase [Eubacterium sp.]|nr:chorismate synthase [Eubacterium sp.]
MAGSTFGKIFKITTWGESHGKALGVVIDGCPAGLDLSESDIQPLLDRRKPGQSEITTQRDESDEVEILSGVFEGKTTGTPISMIIKNEDHNSNAYDELKDVFRPGHADYTYDAKYGFRDHRGGGRSSGRETVARVCAGAVASKILAQLNIKVTAYTKSIGTIIVPDDGIDLSVENIVNMPNKEYANKAFELINNKREENDSVGGTIECIVDGCPAGLGEPVFGKLDAELAKAVMSIGSIKGVEIGSGFDASTSTGSENNQGGAGGILGGISNGEQIKLTAAVKPTPSIAQEQSTIDKDGNEVSIEINGRHDPVIVPRACVVVESMVAITLVDALLENMSATLEKVKDFYK